MKEKTAASPPHIELIGNMQKNFYTLGERDRKNFLFLKDHAQKIVNSPWNTLNLISKEIIKKKLTPYKNEDVEFRSILDSYAKGLNIDPSDFYYSMIFPEFSSCASSWLPDLTTTLLGCSSFIFPAKDGLALTRLTDAPFIESFDKFERTIAYSFNNYNKVFAVTTAGVPTPIFSGMSDAGIITSMHQVFSKTLNERGHSILKIMFKLLFSAKDKKDVLQILKNHPSLTTWSIVLTFPNKEVLQVELSGDRYKTKLIKSKNNFLFFGNLFQLTKNTSTDVIPYGQEKIEHLKNKTRKSLLNLCKKSKLSELDFLKLVTTKNDKSYLLSHLLPFTLSAYTLNPSSKEVYLIPGEGPKFYKGKVIFYSNIWNKNKIKKTPISKTFKQNKWQVARNIALAQKFFDNDDLENFYHTMQMAIDEVANKDDKAILEFFFLVIRFLERANTRMQKELYAEFIEILPKIKIDHLHDHCLLFINRLERMLHHTLTIKEDDFKTTPLKSIFIKEQKIPRPLLYKAVSLVIRVRIELLEIIYGHVKA